MDLNGAEIRSAAPGDIQVILNLIRELAIYEKEEDQAKATADQIHEALFSEKPTAYCELIELDTGAFTGLDSATASATVSGFEDVPAAAARRPNPPRVELIVIVFVPSLSIDAWICFDDPFPTAIKIMTEATPIAIPSVVRVVRNLLVVSPRSANRTISRIFMRRVLH